MQRKSCTRVCTKKKLPTANRENKLRIIFENVKTNKIIIQEIT